MLVAFLHFSWQLLMRRIITCQQPKSKDCNDKIRARKGNSFYSGNSKRHMLCIFQPSQEISDILILMHNFVRWISN